MADCNGKVDYWQKRKVYGVLKDDSVSVFLKERYAEYLKKNNLEDTYALTQGNFIVEISDLLYHVKLKLEITLIQLMKD